MIFWLIFDQALLLYFERSFCCYYLGQQHGVLSQRIGQSASISTGCRVSKSLATSNEHECGGNFCRCRHLRNPDPVWCSFSTFPCWPPSCILFLLLCKVNTDQKVGLAMTKEQEFDPKHFKVILLITTVLNENEG